ncbi:MULTISPECIES: TonB-dependent receptor domain-containing protein [unclassified Acinetobacter]|uniref:TonB-dependent receptor domain-containing protein n=1 Tax=unclassified Acinetobacter TaxID=196816 RepID=UPI0035B9A46C
MSLNASHNERLPSPMELYYHGKHLATNSFEYGNKNLDKERSNNFEIGLMHRGDKVDYNLSAYYNRFKNYIHNETILRSGNLYARRYLQSEAKIYGVEGNITYHINPQHQVKLFGDYVRGKLFNLPTIYGDKIYSEGYDCVDSDGYDDICHDVIGYQTLARPNRNNPRTPPARLGAQWKSEFNDHWSAVLDYTHVFAQKKTSTSIYSKKSEDGDSLVGTNIHEDASKGYNALNLAVDYKNKWQGLDYQLSLGANNLLNQDIYIHTSYLPYVPQIGRNYTAGLTLKF